MDQAKKTEEKKKDLEGSKPRRPVQDTLMKYAVSKSRFDNRQEEIEGIV